MKPWGKRGIAFLLLLVLTVCLVRGEGHAVLDGVYFSAANDRLLDLDAETMPFYSGGQLYIASRFFEGTDLDVRYVRNNSMGLAVLYTTKTDLRFDLVNQRVYDKTGVPYTGRAIEKNGVIFFPVDLVCSFFGLTYTVSATATVPLIRVKSESAVLSDFRFIDATMNRMAARYADYEKSVEENTPVVEEPTPPVIQAREGQKVYLILASSSPGETRAAVEQLGSSKATFLLTASQMEDGDLLRTILGSGHEAALMVQQETEKEILNELLRARELVWKAACSTLQLVWYEGTAEISEMLSQYGCVMVTAEIDRRSSPVTSQSRATALLTTVGRYRKDVSIYLGEEAGCKGGLKYLLSDLKGAEYRLCAWRLTA